MLKNEDSASAALISLIIATRTGATEYFGPIKLLDQIENTVSNFNNVEVILRGDYDDQGFDELIAKIKGKNYSFRVDFVRGNRGRAYGSLHHFYNECLLITSKKKKIVSAIPEDITIETMYWDDVLLAEYELAREKLGHSVFTMHQTTGSGLCDNYDNALEFPDAFPFYTAEWMNAVGGYGHTTAIDSWVQATHYYLLHHYGLDVRHFLRNYFLRRHTDIRDSVAHERWMNGRMNNHDLMRNIRIRKMISKQAENLYTLILEEKSKQLPYISSAYPAVNVASDRFGSAALLFRVVYNLVNEGSSSIVESLPATISTLATRLFHLKCALPHSPEEVFSDIYSPVSMMCPTNYLYNELKIPLLSIPNDPNWLHHNSLKTLPNQPVTKADIQENKTEEKVKKWHPEPVLFQLPLAKLMFGVIYYKAIKKINSVLKRAVALFNKILSKLMRKRTGTIKLTPDLIIDKNSKLLLKLILIRLLRKVGVRVNTW